MDYKEDRQILRKAGFSAAEMEKISQLRRYYVEEGKLLELADYRHLQFIRWLVANGKLTDQVA